VADVAVFIPVNFRKTLSAHRLGSMASAKLAVAGRGMNVDRIRPLEAMGSTDPAAPDPRSPTPAKMRPSSVMRPIMDRLVEMVGLGIHPHWKSRSAR